MKKLFLKPRSNSGNSHSSTMEDPVCAAFRLLPAAILVLVAGLGPEDREVLAYLMTLPAELGKEGAAAVPLSEQPAHGGGGQSGRRRVACATPAAWFVDHPPTHGCGCFNCYVSFWARWDRSSERDRILDALSAFEEHLATAELSATTPSSSKRRGRRRRLPATPPSLPLVSMPLHRPKSMVPEDVELVQVSASPLPPSCLPPASQAPAASTAEQEEVEGKVVPKPSAAAEERKRGWADVISGLVGLRLRGIWNPVVESAT